MGCNLDGSIYYGFPYWGEDIDKLPGDELLDDSVDMEALYANGLGIQRPKEKYPEGTRIEGELAMQYTEEQQVIRDKYDEYWDRVNEAWKVAGVDVGVAGAEGSTELYLYITESRMSCDWTSTKIPEDQIDKMGRDHPNWIEKLREVCRVIGIAQRTPGWHLTASWG